MTAQAEMEQWEGQLQFPPFAGKLVEIHGVEGMIEARGGDQVRPNGLRGRAMWDEEHNMYAIWTFQGYVLDLPEANLQDFARPKPEEGGFDYAWPFAGQEEEFSTLVADTIRKKGYVVVQMFEGDDLRRRALQAAKERPDWMLPKPEFEEAYLGREASSKISMIHNQEAPDSPIEHYNHQVKMMASALYGMVDDFFGFRPDNYRSSTMVRMTLQGPDERLRLFPGPLQQAEVDEGLVEAYLDFVQRRRLCIMYLVDNKGGSLELHPRPDLCQPDVLLPLSRDKMIVFRHDLMGYTYKPKGAYDLVVQSWFMEEQQKLRLDGFQGGKAELEEALGLTGQTISNDRQVHIMHANSRMPGGCYQFDRYTAAFTSKIDGFIGIPTTRWDMDPYYNPDSEQFGAGGKSVTRHAGLMSDEELLCFDNKFFGISEEMSFIMAPTQRILLEISFELLNMAGFSSMMATRGENIGFTVAECSLDYDPWHNLVVTPDAWLEAQCNTSATRVAYLMGLTGMAKQVDTACSSSLVSHNIIHAMLRKVDNDGVERMFSMGHQTLNQPWPFIGLSGAGMLGRTGRCLTFDNSGNGMARAEGVGGLFLKSSSDPCIISERLGVYNSSFVNQDGRSASLTAPNGPSQQLCMRASMKDGNVSPADVSSNENHGTGTALGDPIEVGSVRSVFRLRGDCPIPVTSSKSNLGHQEGTAGSNGLLRTLMTLLNAAVPATVHVSILNQHIEHEGFPAAFPQESLDLFRDNNMAGLNSFGFGGTNSRAELWAHAIQGPWGDATWYRQFDKRKSRPMGFEHLRKLDCVSVSCPRCAGPMCWLCGAALPLVPGPGKHHCSAIREEQSSYEHCSECYMGTYKFGGSALGVLDQGEKVYLTGTWSAWASLLEMKPAADGTYSAEVVMGDTCLEEFHILLDGNQQRALFPVAPRASCRARIVGPSKVEMGKNWLIDGRKDGAQTGSVYEIKFEWIESQRRISWKRLEKTIDVEGVGFEHSYGIISSLSSFRPMEMQRSEEGPMTWEFRGKLNSGEEMFLFQRDRDSRQLIYPLEDRPRSASVPVLGPNAGTGMGKDMRLWSVRGKPGDNVMVRLQVKDGDIKVTAISENKGQMTWHNAHGGARDRYYVKCDWSKHLEEMEPDMADLDVCRLQFSLPSMGNVYSAHFQILVNRDERKVLHPGHPDAAPGQALPEGPDANGEGLCWEVNGPPGQTFEILLDLGAEDHRKMVTCRPMRQMKGLPAA